LKQTTALKQKLEWQIKMNSTRKADLLKYNQDEDSKVKRAFDEDPHLYLMHPKMFVVPDYERRQLEEAQFVKTAVDLTEQMTVKKSKKAEDAIQSRELHN